MNEQNEKWNSEPVKAKRVLGRLIMPILLSMILLVAAYGYFVQGQPQYIQLSIVFALSLSVVREFPPLDRIRYLKQVNVALAVLFLVLGFMYG